MPPRYGASRVDPDFALETSYADPQRVVGPIKAVITASQIVPPPFSVGADTGCANAALRVTGGGHFTQRLGVGVCPISTSPGIDVAGPVQPDTDNTAGRTIGVSGTLRWRGGYFGTELVVGTDPTGSDMVRIGGAGRFTALGVGAASNSAFFVNVNGSSAGDGTNLWTYRTDTTATVSLSGNYIGYYAYLRTAASAITIAAMSGMYLDTGTKGAGSTITTQYGLFIASQALGATNYAIFTNAGLVSLGDATTIRSGGLQVTGNIGLGAAPQAPFGIYMTGGTSTTDQEGMFLDVTGTSAATAFVIAGDFRAGTAAAGFTCAEVTGVYINDAVKGAGSTITTQYGIHLLSQTKGTTSYAIFTNLGIVSFGDIVKLNSVAGLVCANAALSTSATAGFIYIPTSAGAPTGVPGSQTGTVALEYDTTNDKLMVYNSSWKSVASVKSVVSAGTLVKQTTTSTTEVSVGTITVKANTVTAGSIVRITATGHWSAASVNNQFLIKTESGALTYVTITPGATNTEFRYTLWLGLVDTGGNTDGFQEFVTDTNLGTGAITTQTLAPSESFTVDVVYDFRAKVNSTVTFTLDTACIEIIPS